MRVTDDVMRAIEAERVACATVLSELVAVATENRPATGYAPCVARVESGVGEALAFEGAAR